MTKPLDGEVIQEPKKGFWIWRKYIYGLNSVNIPYCKCSECGMGMSNTMYDYCPNCGAKMEGWKNEHIHA